MHATRERDALARILLPDLAREVACLLQVGQLGLEPDHISERCEGKLALDGSFDTSSVVVVPFTSLGHCGQRE